MHTHIHTHKRAHIHVCVRARAFVLYIFVRVSVCVRVCARARMRARVCVFACAVERTSARTLAGVRSALVAGHLAMSAALNHDAWGRYFRKSFRIASAYRRGCSFALAEFAARKYKSHRAIPSDATVDRILQELEQASPKVFERVTKSMQMADARKSDVHVAPGPAVALPLEVADDPAAVWVGVEDSPAADDGVSEGEDASVGAASDEPSRRLQAGLVVLPVEKNMVAKPANVGASLEGAAIEEAQAVQRADGGRAMRKRGHVNYRKERIGKAG
jgi:hypothetical protein